ncbi:hypothetical protein G6O67_007015 [Ophiocordyceps sinensis]|uniref:Uncharacterized protein n=1 Tax=Ophiocordyceps sinensis TaxID=72228 RepID=A0A8H4LTY1_9HYPO|nr:hypothetical protein G6O67_007015 [Ophiocordyceps sinensis]
MSSIRCSRQSTSLNPTPQLSFPDLVVIGNDLVLINHELVVTDDDLAIISRHLQQVIPWRPAAEADQDGRPKPRPRYTCAVCCCCVGARSWADEQSWQHDRDGLYARDEPPHPCRSELRPRYMMRCCRRCTELGGWVPQDVCCGPEFRASFSLVHGRWICQQRPLAWRKAERTQGEAIMDRILLVSAAWPHISVAFWRCWARCRTAMGDSGALCWARCRTTMGYYSGALWKYWAGCRTTMGYYSGALWKCWAGCRTAMGYYSGALWRYWARCRTAMGYRLFVQIGVGVRAPGGGRLDYLIIRGERATN